MYFILEGRVLKKTNGKFGPKYKCKMTSLDT